MATVHQLLDALKLEHAVDRAFVALGREGQPVAIKLEEPYLIGPEARVVPSNIDVMDHLVTCDGVRPGISNHGLMQLNPLGVGWLVANGNYAASRDE